jgi:hypothetical protein
LTFAGEVCQLLLDLDPAQAVVTNIDQLSPLHDTELNLTIFLKGHHGTTPPKKKGKLLLE